MQTIDLSEFPSPPADRLGWPWTEQTQPCVPAMVDDALWPRISIVTPSYNQGQFLEAAIRSVLLQRYPDLEFIIIDGGSTDHSLKIIRKYESWLAYWVSEPDRGQSHAINKGIHKATGDILFWLNSDDLCLPNAFYRVAMAFRINPNASLVIGQAHVIDQDGQTIGDLRSQFSSWEEVVINPGNSVRQISTFFSRALFDELGLLDESLHIAMDAELLIRFTRSHSPLIINDYVAAYRMHAGAKTYTQVVKGYEEVDRTRMKCLSDTKLTAMYRKQSAKNWLRLSKSDTLASSMRKRSLWHAVRQNPSILVSRSFWSSVKKIGIGFLNSYLISKQQKG